MEGIIMNYRRGRKHQYNNQMIIHVEGYDKEKAKALVGKYAIWSAPGKEKKELKGKIKSVHGNSGGLRVYFDKGMPGHAIGQKVKIS